MTMTARVAVTLATIMFAGCGGGASRTAPVARGGSGQTRAVKTIPVGKIEHVVIIVQENRTLNNLFLNYPNATTQSWGLDSNNNHITLQPISLKAPYDLDHKHAAFTTEYDGGKMDGWNNEGATACTLGPNCPVKDRRAYGYVPQSEIQPYWQMAADFVLADNMFQTNQGPSFPAHQFLIAGTSSAAPQYPSLLAAENAQAPGGGTTAGCDSPAGTLGALIDPATGDESQLAFPCFDHSTLFDLIDAGPPSPLPTPLTWRYYQAHVGAGLWNAPDAISHIRNGPDYANVRVPNTKILDDITAGQLPNVSWVIPTAAESDHANITDGSGPAWVARVVNAVGNSKYWNTTAIFVTWDDWGGWFDPVTPTIVNKYELGFRVPLLVISPYARAGTVSHDPHQFGSILRFTEEAFGLPQLGYTDSVSDNLADCFNFNQTPLPFPTNIQATLPASYFRARPDDRNADDDF
jgi:phospholipase C